MNEESLKGIVPETPLSGGVDVPESPDVPEKGPSPEIVREQISQTAADLERNLLELPSFTRFRERDIEPVRQMIEEARQKTHRGLPQFLRNLKYQLWQLGGKRIISRDSGKAFGGYLNVVLEIQEAPEKEERERAREEQDREHKEYLAKPLEDLLEFLEGKTESREQIPRTLLNAVIYKVNLFLEEYAQAYEKGMGTQELTSKEVKLLQSGQILPKIRALCVYRNVGEKVLEYLGVSALQVLTGERGGRTERYRDLIRRIFRETKVEGEEQIEPEEGEVEHFDDTIALFQALNTYFPGGLYTRPTFEHGYDIEFFSRLLLEFLLRRGELEEKISFEEPVEFFLQRGIYKGKISPQEMNRLVGRANRMAAFTNRKRYLDLSRELRKGEPTNWVVRSLKTKMFLDVYPDAWQAYEVVEERQGEMAKILLAQLAKILEEGKDFSESAKRVIGAEHRDIDEAIQSEDAFNLPGKYELAVLALAEAYGKNDKLEGEKMEVLINRLQKFRGKKRIVGRSGKDKARGRARFTTDERLRKERDKLESLEKQKTKAKEATEEERGAQMSDADKALVEWARKAKGLPENLDREIGRVRNNVRRLQNKRTTERDTKEGEYRIERHADILGSLAKRARALKRERPFGEVMEDLSSNLFEVQS